MIDKTNYSLEEIKQDCKELNLKVLELYLEKVSRKDICERLGVKESRIDYLVRTYKLTRFRSPGRHTFNEDRININDPLYWYFLGYFAADGWITKNKEYGYDSIGFELSDKSAIIEICKILNYNGKIGSRKRGENFKEVYYINICNEKLANSIKEIFNNTVYNKSHILEYPNCIPNKDCESMFIRGYWDGDGCFTVVNRSGELSRTFEAKLYSSSTKFISGMKSSLEKYNIYSIGSENEFNIHKKEDVANFIRFIYSYNSFIGLPRKRALAMLHLYYMQFNYLSPNVIEQVLTDNPFNLTETYEHKINE